VKRIFVVMSKLKMMQDWIALLLGLEVNGLGISLIFIIIEIPFKTAALPVADQVTNASVISKDWRIVWVWVMRISIGIGSRVATCLNAANHKQVTMIWEGRIALFKMRHNYCMSIVSTMVVRPRTFVTVTRATTFASLDIQMTDIVSCLAVVESSQMTQVARSVLAISLQVDLLLRPARVQPRTQ